MSTSTPDSKYMLLFRDSDWHEGLSPEQMQQVAGDFIAWFERLTKAGKVIAGNPLERGGKVISGKNGAVVTDGPFTESKETIGGYFLLKVADFDEAMAIARQCPALAYGAKVEVRTVAAKCPLLGISAPDLQLAGNLD